jgi:hypothetical protein
MIVPAVVEFDTTPAPSISSAAVVFVAVVLPKG